MQKKIRRKKGRLAALPLFLYILVYVPICFGFWIYSICGFIYSVFYSWLGFFDTICILLCIIFLPLTSILFLFLFIVFLKLVGFRSLVWGRFIFRLRPDESEEYDHETDDYFDVANVKKVIVKKKES
jgi:hypothetical protein